MPTYPLVWVGDLGRKTHVLDGDRPLCETVGTGWRYQHVDPAGTHTYSRVRDAGVGSPTCHWCNLALERGLGPWRPPQ
jgi:hypothetical protein